MKKRVYGKKLNRSRSARIGLLRSLVRSLVLHGSIKTTKAKAKFLSRQVDGLVSLAQKESVTSRRRLYAKLGNDRLLTDLLFKRVAPTFKSRKSGFTKIIPLPPRTGDLSEMAVIEWVEAVSAEEVKNNKKKESKKVKKVVEKKSKKSKK